MPTQQKALPIAGLVVALASFTHVGVQAANLGKGFEINLAEPVIAGETLLAPGVYTWTLMDSPSNRHIVQIRSHKNGQIVSTILALPAYRERVSSTSELQFWETPTGVPKAVRSWYAPGDYSGQEFAYPSKLLASLRPAPQRQLQLTESKPIPTEPRVVQSQRATLHSHAIEVSKQQARTAEGSWAVIGGEAASPATAKPAAKVRNGFWDKVSHLPLTATIAPLIGLLGLLSLLIFLLTQKKNAPDNAG